MATAFANCFKLSTTVNAVKTDFANLVLVLVSKFDLTQ